MTWQAHYDPFGRAMVVTQTVVNNLRLPRQYYDQETGLHYNYFRDYDPTIGRYVQSDPIGLRGGLNTYAYVNGNPMKFTDSLGLLDPLGEGRPSQGIGGFIDRLYNEILGDDATPSDKANDPADAIAGAPVPPFSIPSEGGKRISIDPTKCPPGHQLIEPSTNPRWIGGLSVEQEYECECGTITRHTVIYQGKVVHDHFRPGPAKGRGGD